MADTVAYIGRDIEDAILLGLIKREDIPRSCSTKLGNTNGEIVYTLVTDLINNSYIPEKISDGRGHIGFSQEVGEYLHTLKNFNYSNIYLHPSTKTNLPLIKNCYETLFEYYLRQLSKGTATDPVDIMTDMDEEYLSTHPPAAMVCDFISGMTDDFFLKQAANVGCEVPKKQ
jgi:dGTPase